MITEQDLQAAIAECKGERNPNANTCIKLAAFLTIQRELYGDPDPVQPVAYSYAPPPEAVENTIDYDSDTDFGRLVSGRTPGEILPVIDELVSDALRAVNPRLYEAFLRRLSR